MIELVEKCVVFVSDGRSIILSQRPWYTNYIKLMEKLNRILYIEPSSIQTIYFDRPLKPLRKSDEMVHAASLIVVLKPSYYRRAALLDVVDSENLAKSSLETVTARFIAQQAVQTLCRLKIIFDGAPFFWTFLKNRPQFFVKGGVVYDFVTNSAGDPSSDVKIGDHFQISVLFSNLLFCWPKDDPLKLKLCTPHLGHFEIKPSIARDIQIKMTATGGGHKSERSIDETLSMDQNPTTENRMVTTSAETFDDYCA